MKDNFQKKTEQPISSLLNCTINRENQVKITMRYFVPKILRSLKISSVVEQEEGIAHAQAMGEACNDMNYHKSCEKFLWFCNLSKDRKQGKKEIKEADRLRRAWFPCCDIGVFSRKKWSDFEGFILVQRLLWKQNVDWLGGSKTGETS